ncbi:TPA: HNH endonuclease, partial [Salmonella enterica]
MSLTKKQRAELRMKFGGRCAYCGCVLPEKGWHADHVE